MKFTELDFAPEVLEGITASGFEEATEIQEKSIPLAMEGKDIVGLARTGSGKTAAFVLPVLDAIQKSDKKGIKALILSPTRELASQIDEQIFALGYHTDASSAIIIGGSDYAQQANAIREEVSILVATPGRLIDQMKLMQLQFEDLEYFILDEADRMLDMGFMPDVKKIVSSLPDDRQTLLFSATMPNEIKKLVSELMNDPVFVEIEASKPAESVKQWAYEVDERQKVDLLTHLMEDHGWDSMIIFTKTKRGADQLRRKLNDRNHDAVSIHGDMEQDEREEALHAFSHGKKDIIVATDVLARGIDIKDVKVIINYDVPHNSDDYIHRIGRTGRYDKEGMAITFISGRDRKSFNGIKRDLDNEIPVKDLPDDLSGSSKGGRRRKKSGSDSSEGHSRKRKTESGSDSDSDTDTDSKHSEGRQSESTEASPRKLRQRPGSQPSSKSDDKPPQEHDQTDERRASEDRDEVDDRSETVREDVVDAYQSDERPRVERASQRLKRKSKPAKGIWGIIKSFFV